MPNNDNLLTDDELRDFEAQVDGRFQTIAARFVMADGRFLALGERLDRIQQELQTLERRSDARCKEIERRLKAVQVQTDHVSVQLASAIDAARRNLAQVLVLGMIGTVVSTALFCIATVLLAI